VIVAALDSLGVPVTSVMAVLGAAGLAIGLALKDSLGNFAAGVMLVMFRPFSKGDFVEVAGISGKVEEIRIFSTYLLTPDNKLIVVPNGQVGAEPITNYTRMDTRRVDMMFGVGYDDDLKTARSVLEKICNEHPLVLDEPATKIFVKELGASSVDFAVRPWCKTDDYWTVWGDLLETGKVELEAAGCNIPYPQTDVHLHTVNSD
ncbi:MAG: mechanosensitive ion channel, partial [Xanthomonadales bacterium]|nr:mechanosensitive ion channel [Xanthomonadales bacterium]